MTTSDDLELGQYFMLRPTNIDRAIKMTGYSREDCETLLERAKARTGEDKVKVPLLPFDIREELAEQRNKEASDGTIQT